METTEFYPMPSFPTLAVIDLAASTRWYQEVLGFKLVFEMPNTEGRLILTHLRWTKYADLLLVPGGDHLASESRGAGVTLTFNLFTGDVDKLAEEARARGAEIVSGPATQPWNTREVTILDPDGYRLKFSQVVDKDASFDEVITRIKGSVGRL